jgi:hypothetical protein
MSYFPKFALRRTVPGGDLILIIEVALPAFSHALTSPRIARHGATAIPTKAIGTGAFSDGVRLSLSKESPARAGLSLLRNESCGDRHDTHLSQFTGKSVLIEDVGVSRKRPDPPRLGTGGPGLATTHTGGTGRVMTN